MRHEQIPAALTTGARSDWVRLGTLLSVRWLAIGGQLTAVLVAHFALGIDLRLDLCLIVILMSASFNVLATLLLPENRRLTESYSAMMLFFDLAQLSALLYLTGGLTNPFAMLIIAPVVVSATVLSLRATIILGGVAIALTSLLLLFYQPLQTQTGMELVLPTLFLTGIWIAIAISIIFLALYAHRVTAEAFSMSEALLATQLALAREQRLSALGGVVAAAAHELGTPLATIKLASSELAEELSEMELPDYLAEDATLIRDQADRCRTILQNMGRAGKDDTQIRTAPISSVVDEAAAPHSDRGKLVVTRIRGQLDQNVPDQPIINRSPEVLHGLRNLVQNAVDFASSTVWIDIDWDITDVRVRVGDDGTGFPADLIGRIGDPFVRQRGRRAAKKRPGYEGMGLGLFIAKTLLERTGAELTFANGTEAGSRFVQSEQPVERRRATGAVIVVAWPRGKIDDKNQTSRQALGQNPLIN